LDLGVVILGDTAARDHEARPIIRCTANYQRIEYFKIVAVEVEKVWKE
jgi:hypothetical protein